MIYNITIVEWSGVEWSGLEWSGVEWTPVPHHLAAFWVESTGVHWSPVESSGVHMDSGGDSKVLSKSKALSTTNEPID